jgi:hypothetical protein
MQPEPTLLDTFPSVEMIRERLSRTLREARLLRSLLRISERAQLERKMVQPSSGEDCTHE